MKKKIWEVMSVRVGEQGFYLGDGWEPFAVTAQDTSYNFRNTTSNKDETHHSSQDVIYLRRYVPTPTE